MCMYNVLHHVIIAFYVGRSWKNKEKSITKGKREDQFGTNATQFISTEYQEEDIQERTKNKRLTLQ